MSKCSIFNFSQPDIDNNAFDEHEMELLNSVDIEDRAKDKHDFNMDKYCMSAERDNNTDFEFYDKADPDDVTSDMMNQFNVERNKD